MGDSPSHLDDLLRVTVLLFYSLSRKTTKAEEGLPTSDFFFIVFF